MTEIRDIKFWISQHILISVQVMISALNIFFLLSRNFAWNHLAHSMVSGLLRTDIISFRHSEIYGGPQLSHQNQMLTANSNRSQQIQIVHSKFKLLTANYKLLTPLGVLGYLQPAVQLV